MAAPIGSLSSFMNRGVLLDDEFSHDGHKLSIVREKSGNLNLKL
jgi:hypothetical protein